MAGGNKKIRPEDGKQFSTDYQPEEKWTEANALKLGNDLIEWLKNEDENVFFDDFLFLSCDETLYAGKIYPTLPNYLSRKFLSFSNLLEKAKKIQETKLVKFSTFDKLNATMTKFVLINNHDWREKNEIDHTTGGEKITKIERVIVDTPNNNT